VFLISSLSGVLALAVRRFLPESRLWIERKSTNHSAAAVVQIVREQRLGVPLLLGFVLGVFKLGTYWTCYTWLPKFLQSELHQPIGRSMLWILSAQLGQLLGMMAFGVLADHYGRRKAFTAYSLLTAAALYPLAFHWESLLLYPVLFWSAMFALGLGSGCTAGFGALLAELFPTEVRNVLMGTAYNCARGVQFFAPILVSAVVVNYGFAGALSVPLVLALATAAWVWTLPETRQRDLAQIGQETAID
jgi:MFS family permease